ncbi:MAG: hypothetical protein MJZ30_10095 [Paludibacteraceae bacterium]|nr:hypothetical protein [Paludibacteraceae bacterium]
MIELLAPVALMASGGYMIYKSSGEGDGNKTPKTTAPKTEEPSGPSALQKLQMEAELNAKTPVTNNNSSAIVDDANARGRETATNEGKTSQSTKSALYFGDKNGVYDQFYDYTKANGADENLFDGTRLVVDASAHGQYYRSRIISPFFAETQPLAWNLGSKAYQAFGDSDVDRMTFKNNEVLLVRSAYRGEYRQIAFVLEVFNPFNRITQLQQIIIRNVKIAGKACHIVNDGGWCHEGLQDGNMSIMNKMYTIDSDSTDNLHGTLHDVPAPFIWECDIAMPKRGSVLIPIFLQVATTTLSSENTKDLYTHFDDTAKARYIRYEGKKRYGESKWISPSSNKMLCYPIREDMDEGVMKIVYNDLSAPPSLKDGDFSCDITLSSGQNFSVNKTKLNNGDYDIHALNCSLPEHLALMHSYRAGYDSNDAYQKSFIGDYEGSIPYVMKSGQYYVSEALGDCIMGITKGFPLETDFPKLLNQSYSKYSFKNDFAHKNYCF